MLDIFHDRQSWYECNQKLIKKLGLEQSNFSLHISPGFYHALLEKIRSLAGQYMAKKKVYYIKEYSFFLKETLKSLAVDGFELLEVSLDDFNKESFISGLDSSVLAIIAPQDLPLVGFTFNRQDVFKKIHEQKVFTLQTSHICHYYNPYPKELSPYQIQINELGLNHAIVLSGRRAQSDSDFSASLYWDWKSTELALEKASKKLENKERVLSFEGNSSMKNMINVCKYKRIYDRALLCWEDLDANALRQWLIGQKPELKVFITTTSLSLWGGVTAMNWLEQFEFSKKQIRGLLVLDVEILNEELKELILRGLDKIRLLQGVEQT